MGKSESETTTIIDAQNLILGRMASVIAKRLLEGEKMVVVNAEKAVVSGRRSSIVKKAEDFLQVGHFRKGPLHVRRPDNIVRKTIRGMVPNKKPRGVQAMKRLRVFIGVPKGYTIEEKHTIPEIEASSLRCPYITVYEMARAIGWSD